MYHAAKLGKTRSRDLFFSTNVFIPILRLEAEIFETGNIFAHSLTDFEKLKILIEKNSLIII